MSSRLTSASTSRTTKTTIPDQDRGEYVCNILQQCPAIGETLPDKCNWQSASFVISLSRHRALTDVQILGVITPDICIYKPNHQDNDAGPRSGRISLQHSATGPAIGETLPDKCNGQSASFVISLSRHRALTDVQILGVITPDIYIYKPSHQDNDAGPRSGRISLKHSATVSR